MSVGRRLQNHVVVDIVKARPPQERQPHRFRHRGYRIEHGPHIGNGETFGARRRKL